MKEASNNKNPRSKRSLMVINLVETPAGYSVIEGTQTFNKNGHVQVQSNPTVNYNPAQAASKEQKMVVKQNHLLLLKAPTKFQHHDTQQSICKTPPSARQFASWFSLSCVHPIELTQVELWVLEDHPSIPKEQILESELFKEKVEKYRRQRNLIIEVYGQKYGPTKKYMAGSVIRKYICDDAYWLMRIHVFLNSEGIINNKHINLQNQQFRPHQIFLNAKEDKSGHPIPVKQFTNSRLFKEYPERGYQNEKNLILKKITNNIRPYCDFCGIHCNIVWFQHLRTMDPKQISTIMKNVNSKNPPLSQKEYEIVLCTKCYCNDSFPLLLTHHDFRKVTINDKLEPDRKKKSSKHKRKEEKRKRKEKQLMQQNEDERDYQEDRNGDAQALPNGKHHENQEVSHKKEEEEEDLSVGRSGRKRNRVYTNEAMRLTQSSTNHVKQNPAASVSLSDNNAQTSSNSVQNASKVNEIIQQIVSKIQPISQWSNQQVYTFLQLVEEKGDNWDEIKNQLTKKECCLKSSTQDLISKFIELSQKHISFLNQEPKGQKLTNNCLKNVHKSTFLTKLVQKNLNTAVQITPIIPALSQEQKNQRQQQIKMWKSLLDNLAALCMQRIQSKIELTEKLQVVGIKMDKFSEEARKLVQQE